MNIKNYTSEVPVDRSMSKIEKMLVSIGAKNIMRSYDDYQECKSISFTIHLASGVVSFQLPSRTEKIYDKLYSQYTRPTEKSIAICQAQAGRTAWKIISDWVEIQATMILLDQADLMQVFLPYVHDGNSSLYEKLKGQDFKLLK